MDSCNAYGLIPSAALFLPLLSLLSFVVCNRIRRAVYEVADIYFLDDPLSAVDSHVGSALMNNCICSHLKGTTRILVTHQVQFLGLADQIIVMENGRIQNSGTYQQLLDDGVDFKQVTISTSDETSTAPYTYTSTCFYPFCRS